MDSGFACAFVRHQVVRTFKNARQLHMVDDRESRGTRHCSIHNTLGSYARYRSG